MNCSRLVVNSNRLVVQSVSYSLYAVMNRFDAIPSQSYEVVFSSSRDDCDEIVTGLEFAGVDVVRVGVRRWYGIQWDGQPMLSLGVACVVVSVWVIACFAYSQGVSSVHAQVVHDSQQFSHQVTLAQRLWDSVVSSRESVRTKYEGFLALCDELLRDESFDLLSCRVEMDVIDIVGMYQGVNLSRLLSGYRDRLSLESSVALVDSRHVVRLVGAL